MRRPFRPMSRRPSSAGTPSLLSPSPSSPLAPSRISSKHPPAPPAWRRGTRLWVVVLVVTFIIFERTSVFVAPARAAAVSPELVARDTAAVDQPPVRVTVNGSAEQTPGREANIAYFIQIAENTIGHLPRLLRRIYHRNNVYAIHFDLKIPPAVLREAKDKIRANPEYAKNVHIMTSELITYRGISMLLNTINAMRLLIDEDAKWDYFINLSGADYPLLSAHSQRSFLGREMGLNYFTFAPKRTWDAMAENRLAQVWYDEGISFRKTAAIGKLERLDIRNPIVDNRNFDVSHAEAWMIASRDFCDFVVRGDMARKMLVAFAFAADSSEHYFASLAWNHEKYKKSIVPHSMRMVVWMHNGVLAGQHPYYIDEREENGQYKFKQEVATSVLFFARKFQEPDSPLMDFVDRRTDDKDLMDKVFDHISRKIAGRARRLAEL